MGAARAVTARLGGRAEAMAARIAGAARRAGTPAEGVAAVQQAFRAAMQPRIARIEDEHHPAWLHPGRTVLILLGDTGTADPAVLAAAALAETIDLELAVPDPEGAEGSVRELLSLVPVPARDGTALAERLVTAPTAARLIALAERLDHARHLHLRGSGDRASFRTETREIYLPVAERTHPALARRFQWWCGRGDRP